MSLAIRQDGESVVRTSPFQIDYAGERDHSLTELSDILPYALYEAQKIN